MRIALCLLGLCLLLPCLSSTAFSATSATTELNLHDFGAVGDGVADDGPAFQKALDALAAAGGGTLFVPEGHYAIVTPVSKNFAGLASSITIKGVESLTPVSPPSATGNELAEGLDLLTEIYPRTGRAFDAFHISGLQTLLVKDIAFVGTEGVDTDAANTLYLSDIGKAQIVHSEFAVLASIFGGSIVNAERCDLEVTECKFLGCTTTSGGYAPVVQNVEWYGITVTDSVFLDYGLRAAFSKTGLAAPISWINIGNAAAVTNTSPRREVVIRDTFLDEGGYWGISSLPFRYTPPSAPIDLVYINGLQMNVSNFFQYGHLFYDVDRVFIENSRYGWSHNASAAIALANVDEAIFDKITCEAHADHIVADNLTGELTVINSTYTALDSLAQTTNAITTSPGDDPVQYVRNQFVTVLGRDPDPAAHFYWSDLLVHCFADSACVNNTKAALNDYLSKQPSAKFAISGHIADRANVPVAGVKVTLSGSQSVSTTTDSNGNYDFTNLPTSGRYVITPSKDNFIFESPSRTFITPSSDQTANFTADHTQLVTGVIRAGATPLAGVVVTVSGSTTSTAITDGNGVYSFALPTGGSYVLTPTKAHYTFNPTTKSIDDLQADTQADFIASVEKFSISGHVVNTKGEPMAGVTMVL
ncbi:MAG TPA: carboxypeptidase regulatory-like domain-containing protein, partial [Pyrinomonadaceae bacterium]|nr:carboxypeptidase regulatory-like domain-containing protein [Pyrinomonadaceae bacterium]